MNPYLALKRAFICIHEDHEEWSILVRGDITHEEVRLLASYLQQQHVMGRGWKIEDHDEPIYRNGYYDSYMILRPKQETLYTHYWQKGIITILLDEVLTLRNYVTKFVSFQSFLNTRIPKATQKELEEAMERLSESERAELRCSP